MSGTDGLYRDGGLNGGDRPHDCLPQAPQERVNRFQSPVGLSKKYARGALVIIVNVDDGTARKEADIHRVGTADKHITFHTNNAPLWRSDGEGRMGCAPENRGDDVVLIRVVKFVEFEEIMTFPAREGFRSLDGVFHPLAGCFYSLAKGFEIHSITAANNKLGSAIFCALPDVGQFPSDMVEGAAQIVDSVAYYKGEGARELLSKFDPHAHGAGVIIALDHKSVRFRSNEGGELPFDVGHVMIGPLDFLFGTIENDESPQDKASEG